MYVYVFVEVCEYAQHNKIFGGSFFIEILQENSTHSFCAKGREVVEI